MSVRSALQCLVVASTWWSLARAAPAESVENSSVSFSSPLGNTVPSSSNAKIALAEVGNESLTLVSTRQIGVITESVLSRSNSAAPVKRGTVDLRGAKCATQCGWASGPIATTADCVVVYNTLYSQPGSFTINGNTIVYWKFNNCSAYLINNTGDNITYDYQDYGGVTQWLNGYCVKDRGATIGTCMFAQYSDFAHGVYTTVNHPNYFPASSNGATTANGTTPAPANGTTPGASPDAVGTDTDTTDADSADPNADSA